MDKNIFREYKELLEENSLISAEEVGNNIIFNCPEIIHTSLVNMLEEEFFDFDETDMGFLIHNTPIEELLELIEECDFYNFLIEGNAQRKIVIRGGKRKIIFKCPPGYKKVKRACRKRPSGELMKLKRRARMTARKSKGKRARAIRRRKISLRRRRSIPKTRRH